MLEAVEEHHLAKVALWELERLPASAPNFDAKFTVLKENILHHVSEEEGDDGLFQQARKALKANELEELGDRDGAGPGHRPAPAPPAGAAHPAAQPPPRPPRLDPRPGGEHGKGVVRAAVPDLRR